MILRGISGFFIRGSGGSGFRGLLIGLGVAGLGVVGLVGFGSSGSLANDVPPLDVKFMEEGTQIASSLSGKAGDAVSGRKIFSNRKLGNCLACHVNSDMMEHSFHGEVGPSLDGVADRYEASELRAILVDSKKALNEETIMPGFYSLDQGVRIAKKFQEKTILSAQQVEDVLAYLKTLKETN